MVETITDLLTIGVPHPAGGYAVGFVNQHNVVTRWMSQATATHSWMMARIANSATSVPDDKVVVCRKVSSLVKGDPLELRNVRETLRILETLTQLNVPVEDVIFYKNDQTYASMRQAGLLLPLENGGGVLECLFHDSVSHRLFGSAFFSDVQGLITEYLRSDIRWERIVKEGSTIAKGKYRVLTRVAIAYISSTIHSLSHADVALIRAERANAKRGQPSD